MSDIVEDKRIYPLLVSLAGCLCGKLAEFNIQTCFCGVVFGDTVDVTPVAEDGSMGWVRLANIAPIEDETTGQRCQVRLGATIQVGFGTCYPIDADPLTVDEQLEVTRMQMSGMQASLQAILCCDWVDRGRQLQIGEYQPLGPEGGVVGGTWTLAIEL